MASDWRTSTWGEEISLEYGKALRGYHKARGKYRVFGANGPVGWTSVPLVNGPGVILGRKGAYRGVQYSHEPFFVIDTAYYVAPKADLNMRWLYYAIVHHKLGEIDDGSPIPSTTRAAVHMLDVEVPPANEQRAIAHILGTLDDKIELNRRMSETLEAMARALFKSRFVGFDGHDELEASAVGPIPRDWTVGTLADVATNPRRTVKPDAIPSGSHYIALEHMPRRSITLADWTSADGIGSGKYEFNRGEILFGKLRPYFHKVGVPAIDGVCSTDILVIVPKSSAWFGYVLMHASSAELIAHATACSTGTKMPRTSWRDIGRYEVVLPPEHEAAAFSRTMSPLVERIHTCVHESRTLRDLRDTLLPKLISGEIRIADAERFVEAAT